VPFAHWLSFDVLIHLSLGAQQLVNATPSLDVFRCPDLSISRRLTVRECAFLTDFLSQS
jgi:hypothetical protein